MRLGKLRMALLLSAVLTALNPRGVCAQANQYPACGAVSSDGRFAAALATPHSLDLEISRLDSTAQTTRLALEGVTDECRLDFDRGGQYVVAGVKLFDQGKTWLRIGVFDTHAGNWISSFDVDPGPDLPFPVRFEGFLSDGSNLVVTGFAHGTYHKPEKSAVSVGVFSLGGHLVKPVLVRTITDSYFNWSADFADVTHNRLWFNHDPHFCPLRSTTLTGPLADGPTVSQGMLDGAVCDLADAMGFPDADTLVGSTTRSDQTWVWRVDLAEQKGEKFELPDAPRRFGTRWNQYHVSRELPVSADGQVFAVARAFIAWNLLDQAHFEEGAVYVIQTRPLRLLSVVNPRNNCGPVAVAVDHRNGQTSVLAHQCGGGWKLNEVPLVDPK